MRRILLLMVVIASLVFVAVGLHGALQSPRIVRYKVPIIGLQAPLRIVQLSDTHANWITMRPDRLASVVAKANALKPDLFVLSGDYNSSHLFDWPWTTLEQALYSLAKLRAPLGVYAVGGNHDPPMWTRRVFARTPVRLLMAEVADAGPILIAGAESLSVPPDPFGNLRRAVKNAPPGKPLIIVTHEPEFFQLLPRRAQLLIAGHTHGGQILLPGLGALRPTTPFLEAHLRGLFREHGQTMVVSSGLGTSVLPLRIGVQPEIVEIMLVPA
ncbi:MAG: metallophosphoesterase [Polymorphobacter sp.]